MTDIKEPSVEFQAAIRERLSYCPETGNLYWLEPSPERFSRVADYATWRTRFAGQVAGKTRSDGYRAIRLTIQKESITVLAHHLALFMLTGVWPVKFTDHINGDRSDNRAVNLRAVSRQENQRNQKRRTENTSGYLGVNWAKHAKKWCARITFDGRQKNLGYFNCVTHAAVARKLAEQQHGYHENHGRA